MRAVNQRLPGRTLLWVLIPLFALAHRGDIWIGDALSGKTMAEWGGPRATTGGLLFLGPRRLAAALSTGRVVVWEIDLAARGP